MISIKGIIMLNSDKIRAFGEWEEQELLMLSIPHSNSDWAEYLDEILDSYEELVSAVSKYQKPRAASMAVFSFVHQRLCTPRSRASASACIYSVISVEGVPG